MRRFFFFFSSSGPPNHNHQHHWHSLLTSLLLPLLLIATIPTGNGFLQVCPALINVPILTVGLDADTGTFYYIGMAVYQNIGGGATTTNHDAVNRTRRLRRRRRQVNVVKLMKEDSSSSSSSSSTSSESLALFKRLRQHAASFLNTTSHHTTSNASSSIFVRGNHTTTSISGNSSSDGGDNTTTSGYSGDQVFYVRECGCFSQTRDLTHRFCPAVFDTCGITSDAMYNQNAPVACFMSQTLHEEILRSAWPILLVWVALVAGICGCTDLGMDARHYVLNTLCRRQTHHGMMVERILHAPPHGRFHKRRLAFLNSYLVEVGLHPPPPPPLPTTTFTNNTIPPPPTQIPIALELKTKRYKAPVRDDDDDHHYHHDNEVDDGHDEAVSCTICFHPLEDGDRIGALDCSHNFHVECLKSWLSRRNTCPLCQAPNVATTRYEELPVPSTDHEDATDNTAAATPQEPVVVTQVSPFANPFSSTLIRQQVMRNMEERRQQRQQQQQAAPVVAVSSTLNTTPNEIELPRRGRDSFRGVTILPQR